MSKHEQWATRLDTDIIFHIRLNAIWIFSLVSAVAHSVRNLIGLSGEEHHPFRGSRPLTALLYTAASVLQQFFSLAEASWLYYVVKIG